MVCYHTCKSLLVGKTFVSSPTAASKMPVLTPEYFSGTEMAESVSFRLRQTPIAAAKSIPAPTTMVKVYPKPAQMVDKAYPAGPS